MSENSLMESFPTSDTTIKMIERIDQMVLAKRNESFGASNSRAFAF